uniref:M23 family metallopeptidase n=1 Tax=Coralloluteibacterium stylophorae TaxID=1776034 RepID=A0A8J7VSH4_9GAMM
MTRSAPARRGFRIVLAALCVLTAVAGCGPRGGNGEGVSQAPAALPWTRSERERRLARIEDEAARAAWTAAAEEALAQAPTAPGDAYAERGRLQPGEAVALRIEVPPGQVGRIRLQVHGQPAAPPLAELYRLDGATWRRLGDSVPAGAARRVEEGVHAALVQADPGAGAGYTLQLSRGGRAMVPVEGAARYDIGGVYGDPRPGGRIHEGIDVFAERGTPVLAAEQGVAMQRQSDLGGRTVWLRAGSGLSYYYAHLDEVAIEPAARVEQGEVLGGVGSSGNAQGTPPHLHFGIYRRGRGSIDPLPSLAAPPQEAFEPIEPPAWPEARVDASALNLRAAPGDDGAVRERLERGARLRVLAATDRAPWLRVRAGGVQGFVHGGYLAEATAADGPPEEGGARAPAP